MVAKAARAAANLATESGKAAEQAGKASLIAASAAAVVRQPSGARPPWRSRPEVGGLQG
ncbi:hypothetical protein [Streptomyces collinus]|uniref:hypothetical protein n=1 Tax=Streptomyces collinus TaxID=42684 RepID=UPI00294214CA|nr:hypothetical protein [Streptomyces collinus]